MPADNPRLSYPQFVARLRRAHGPAAESVRHELYFLSDGRARLHQGARAVAALLRDTAMLALGDASPASGTPGRTALFVVTLPGANGVGTLLPAIDALRRSGTTMTSCAHRRARAALGAATPGTPVGRVPRLVLRSIPRSVAAAHAAARGRQEGLSRLAVFATVLRGALWRAAWQRALQPRSGVLVLHNDFDMMSAAAVDAARLATGWTSLCLQHGIPTDEFFPVRADRHFVWGARSRTAYLDAGTDPARIEIDPLARGGAPAIGTDAPAGLVLLSQTHTRQYGEGLATSLAALAADLQKRHPALRILLHPEERHGNHPYGVLQGARIEDAPHALLRPGAQAHLIAGFSSTALFDALAAGHYVVGLDWEARASEAAAGVASPPRRVADAAALLDFFHLLQSDVQARRRYRDELIAWHRENFGATGAFAASMRTV